MHKNRIGKSPRRVKIPNKERLANIALYYLSRYAASEQSLRRVLENRIRRAAMRDPAFAAETEKHRELRNDIETIIALHQKTGALNDTIYAENRANSLRRSGRSRRVIERTLMLKGVKKDLIKNALRPEEESDDPEAAEIAAAIKLAKRKSMGPFRKSEADRTQRQKEIATLARAGFSLDIARKVLGGAREDYDVED